MYYMWSVYRSIQVSWYGLAILQPDSKKAGLELGFFHVKIIPSHLSLNRHFPNFLDHFHGLKFTSQTRRCVLKSFKSSPKLISLAFAKNLLLHTPISVLYCLD